MTSVGKLKTAPDPITAEIITHSLRAITEELEVNLTRTSFSPLVYEYKDYAVGVVSASGELIAQSQGGLPIFLADIGGPLPSVLECHPLETFEPGDAVITNDPGACGQHLNNVNMYMPVFADGAVVAFIAVRPHWSDVGGKVLGSCLTNDTSDIFQEGIQLPALKLVRAGEFDRQLLRLIEKNTRLPEMVIGDMQAQLSACRLGVERFSALLNKFGWEAIHSTILDRWSRSEEVTRQRVAALPDGEYSATCWLDNDGVNKDRRVSLDVIVRIRGDELEVDLSNISEQVGGSCNAGYFGGGTSVAKVAFRYAITPDLPADEGCFRPLKLTLPPGKVLSSDANAPKARWNLLTSSAIDAILHALSQAMPTRSAAGHHAAQSSIRFVGRRPNGRQWAHHDTAHGGFGAWAHGDGPGPYKTLGHGDTKDIPVEIVEALYPVVVERLELRRDSGGSGQHRGGLGMVRRYRIEGECHLNSAFERTTCPPHGLFGGKPASVGGIHLQRPDGSEVQFSKSDLLPIPPGSVVTFYTAGGGGYGDPLDRPLEDVERDVRLGYVSIEAAHEHYGVDIDPQTMRARLSATDMLRAQRRSAAPSASATGPVASDMNRGRAPATAK